MSNNRLLCACVVIMLGLHDSAHAFAQHDCASLSTLQLTDTSITTAVDVPAGPFAFPAVPLLTPGVKMQLPEYCKVAGTIRPTPDSSITFQVWMPVQGWNGRFMQVGNGGFGGAILPIFFVQALAEGYAVAGTDDGHQGGGIEWAVGHPERMIDFAYRAVHVTSERSKEVVKAFYGKAQKRSYFNGCSEGGREALMEAQRFPEDFDGILAGDPGQSFTHLFLAGLWNSRAFQESSASYVPPAKLKLVQAASIAACDAQDGVKDGIISDPVHCHFNPNVLLCKEQDGDDCLTAAQVKAVSDVYAGPVNPRTGARVNYGIEPGFETNMAMFEAAPGTTKPAGLDEQFFRTVVFQDPHWDPKSINFDSDVALADQKGAVLDVTNPDLKRFQARGGKLIQYHGWNDPGVPPLASVRYYETVVNEMGGAKKTAEFFRLYMVPGMFHCWGGPGPNDFGQILAPMQPGAAADNDIQQLMVRWVEQGVAPDNILASKFPDDDPSKSVVMTRPLCPYPKIAQWSGRGTANDAANFRCETPKP